MLRILIAEDEWLVAFTLRAQLDERQCEVIGIAASGDEAVEMCCSQHPDVVLMDIRMPSMDGIEATRRIMQECPTCVVMLTAHGQEREVASAENAGAIAYLVKPMYGDQIIPALQSARRRFDEFMYLQQQLGGLAEALRVRKLVEKAKGMLIDREDIPEADAFGRLRELAKEHQLSLEAASEEVISQVADAPST